MKTTWQKIPYAAATAALFLLGLKANAESDFLKPKNLDCSKTRAFARKYPEELRIALPGGLNLGPLDLCEEMVIGIRNIEAKRAALHMFTISAPTPTQSASETAYEKTEDLAAKGQILNQKQIDILLVDFKLLAEKTTAAKTLVKQFDRKNGPICRKEYNECVLRSNARDELFNKAELAEAFLRIQAAYLKELGIDSFQMGQLRAVMAMTGQKLESLDVEKIEIPSTPSGSPAADPKTFIVKQRRTPPAAPKKNEEDKMGEEIYKLEKATPMRLPEP